MEITVLCVDDDQHAIDALKGHLSFYSFINVVGEANDGESALAFLTKREVDLMFLDIEMDGMNGIQLAQHIKNMYPHIMIVFVTGHAGFALEGYEADPVDYIMKPVNVRRLDRVLEKVQRHKQVPERSSDDQIGMKVDGGIRIVNVEDILYIEKKGRKISINCKDNESFETTHSLKNLETIFAPYHFYRSHQSFIVPMYKIKAIFPDTYARSYSIVVEENKQLPLSRNKYNELQDLLEENGISII